MPTKVYGLNGFDEGGAPIIGGTVTPQARPARGGMIIDEGGAPGIIATLEAGIADDGRLIASITPSFSSGVTNYTLNSGTAGNLIFMLTLNGEATITAATEKADVEIIEEGGMINGRISTYDLKNYFSETTEGGVNYYTGTLTITATEEGGDAVNYVIAVKIDAGGGPK